MIPAILLAAGRSTRMGRSKALLPLGRGDTFLSRIVGTLSDAGIEEIVVVAGHEAGSIVAALDGPGASSSSGPVRVVINDNYDAGQLSSLIAGLRVIDRPGVVAALVTLVDVPLVTAATVRAVVDRYRHTKAPVVRPIRGNRHGHPVLIDRSMFDAMRAADVREGPKPVIRAHATAAGDVQVDDDGAFCDIDTPEEYARVMAALRVRE